MSEQSKLLGDVRRADRAGALRSEDNERYQSVLKEKLKEPAFRLEGGFPDVSSDQDILDLSEAPFFTACPNPFVAEVLKSREEDDQEYSRNQYAADVSDGKNDPIYRIHSYHTKVPHKAIMRYILHYTDPGDVVFDGFCGTGMTGVAAVLCGHAGSVESLGYQVRQDGAIVDEDSTERGRIGRRRAILSDLSPIATFIARNYTDLHHLQEFVVEAMDAVDRVECAMPWLYEVGGRSVAAALWSDVFICPVCSVEFSFHEAVGKSKDLGRSFPCPHCGALVGKVASRKAGVARLERKFETVFDPQRNRVLRQPGLTLVGQWVNVGKKRVFIEAPTNEAQALANRIRTMGSPRYPLDAFRPGRQTNKLIHGSGIQFVSQMYTPRALLAYAALWETELSTQRHTRLFRFCLTAINNYISRKQGYSGGGGGISGTLFTPSDHLERNVFGVLRRKLQNLGDLGMEVAGEVVVSTQSISDLSNIPSGRCGRFLGLLHAYPKSSACIPLGSFRPAIS
jgi:hypothetical protein